VSPVFLSSERGLVEIVPSTLFCAATIYIHVAFECAHCPARKLAVRTGINTGTQTPRQVVGSGWENENFYMPPEKTHQVAIASERASKQARRAVAWLATQELFDVFTDRK
jgi:hypothetical protein